MSEQDGFTEEEAQNLLSSFRKLKLHPKADTPEDLLQWMSQVGKPKQEHDDTPDRINPATLTSVTLAHSPQLPYFSGDRKGDADFDQWKHEYTWMVERYSTKVVSEAVRRSLRGKAARVAMHVDKNASLDTLIAKLDSVFGYVHTEQNIMAQFYTAKQGPDESVAEWSCRLEDIVVQAVALGKVQSEQTEEMLRNSLWAGLRSELKDLTSHRYEQGGSLDSFRKYLRQMEAELAQRSSSKTKGRVASIVSTEHENSELQEIKVMLKSMSSEILALKKQSKDTGLGQPDQSQHSQGQYGQGQHGQGQYGQGQHGQGRGQPGQGSPWTRPPRRGSRPYGRPYGRGDNGPQTLDTPVCYRCGQPGHIKKGCRTRLEEDTSVPLNYNRLMGRGGPWV